MSDNSVYQRVTDQIVSAIESGAGKYIMPWHTSSKFADSPVNVASAKAYRGINTLVLWGEAQHKGYESGAWGTYKQWQDRGAQVRKGEKSTHVVFWKFFRVGEAAEGRQDGEVSASERTIPMARDYSVFNAAQVDGYTSANEPEKPIEERIASAEEFFSAVGVTPRPGGNRAYYQPSTDQVHMPPFNAFTSPIGYYSVLAHETTHWTSHASRCDRQLGKRFGDSAYAMEELIAEMGAAFTCAQLGLQTEPREDHAPYIASWLKVLKGDARAIFTAASKAQQAADWMQARANGAEIAIAA